MTRTTTSPLEALRPFLGDATKGQVVVVLATPGLGKTALLIHAALDAMGTGSAVLHVDVAHTVSHVCSRYDALCEALGIVGETRRTLERHRMVHSVLGQHFEVAPLAAHLQLLRQHAGFVPGLIAVDGLDPDAVVEVIDDLVELASEQSVPLWVTMNIEGPIPPEVRAAGTVGVRMQARGDAIVLSVLVDGGETELPVLLRSSSLVIGGAEVEADPLPAQIALHSGGAQGAEAAFGALAERYGLTEINYTFPGHKQARTVGTRTLTARELESGDVSMVYVSRRLNRTYSTEATVMRGILHTLWHMVSNARQVFVVGRIQPDGTVIGGTGWSVELARMWNKDLWVYCQDQRGWFHRENETWIAGSPRIRATTICGTGTRKLQPHGQAALEALFADSFGYVVEASETR